MTRATPSPSEICVVSPRDGGKLDYQWVGPYVVLVMLGKGLSSLKELQICVIQNNLSYLCDHSVFHPDILARGAKMVHAINMGGGRCVMWACEAWP